MKRCRSVDDLGDAEFISKVISGMRASVERELEEWGSQITNFFGETKEQRRVFLVKKGAYCF